MDISVIIPVYNEEGNVAKVYEELKEAVSGRDASYEVIFVDDGSTDASFSVMEQLAAGDAAVRAVKLRRNFGQSSAIAAGVNRSSGEVIVLMDGDAQNDPADIPGLVDLVREGGYDIASGWRKGRKDNFLFKTLPSKIANRIISFVTRVKLNDYGCTLKAYRAEVLKKIPLYGEWHRFLPALASWMGAKIIEIPVNHRKRASGKSKYNILKAYKVVLDIITIRYFLSYYSSPMYLFGKIGILLMLPGLIIGGYYTFKRFIFWVDIGHKVPSLIFSAFSVLSGIIVIMFGLLAEMFTRMQYQDDPTSSFIIEKVISGEDRGERADEKRI